MVCTVSGSLKLHCFMFARIDMSFENLQTFARFNCAFLITFTGNLGICIITVSCYQNHRRDNEIHL